MPVVSPIDVKAFSLAAGSAGGVLREWNRSTGRMIQQADSTRGAIGVARRGGTEVGGAARGVQAESGNVVRGVSSSDPRSESNLANQATGNLTGVSGAIKRAEQNAFDPRAEAPPVDTGAPEREVGPEARSIGDRGRGVSRESGRADQFERDARNIP